MHGDLQVVQPYSRTEFCNCVDQQVADVADQPPAGLSDVDRDCWQAVHQAYPTARDSAVVQQVLRRTLQKWSREFVLEQDPSLGPRTNEVSYEPYGPRHHGVGRARNPNLGQGNKTIRIRGYGLSEFTFVPGNRADGQLI